MEDKIMPCRFCGSDAKLLKLQNDNGDAVYGVFCTKDLEAECSHGHYIDNYATAEEAINEWNFGFVRDFCSEDNCIYGGCPFSPEEAV